jgi:hypothetical protein
VFLALVALSLFSQLSGIIVARRPSAEFSAFYSPRDSRRFSIIPWHWASGGATMSNPIAWDKIVTME